MFAIGTDVRFVRDVYDSMPVPDVTVGKIYTIAGKDVDGEIYFYDDSGEENFSAADDGDGVFEEVV